MNFAMTDDETERAVTFTNDHRPVCPIKDTGAIGGRFTYEFTPTGLGTCVVVTCVCGAELNITDYRDW
jgi:hypothetical protein